MFAGLFLVYALYFGIIIATRSNEKDRKEAVDLAKGFGLILIISFLLTKGCNL